MNPNVHPNTQQFITNTTDILQTTAHSLAQIQSTLQIITERIISLLDLLEITPTQSFISTTSDILEAATKISIIITQLSRKIQTDFGDTQLLSDEITNILHSLTNLENSEEYRDTLNRQEFYRQQSQPTNSSHFSQAEQVPEYSYQSDIPDFLEDLFDDSSIPPYSTSTDLFSPSFTFINNNHITINTHQKEQLTPILTRYFPYITKQIDKTPNTFFYKINIETNGDLSYDDGNAIHHLFQTISAVTKVKFSHTHYNVYPL